MALFSDVMARLGVVEGRVLGRIANDSGYYLLVEPPRSVLALRPPRPMYVGVDRQTYARAREGQRFVIGGERA